MPVAFFDHTEILSLPIFVPSEKTIDENQRFDRTDITKDDVYELPDTPTSIYKQRKEGL